MACCRHRCRWFFRMSCVAAFLCLLLLTVRVGQVPQPRPAPPSQELWSNQHGQRVILDAPTVKLYVATDSEMNTPITDSSNTDTPITDSPNTDTPIADSPNIATQPDTGCHGPWPEFPDCDAKMEWMTEMWRSDPCYAAYGVDGTRCSFQIYLSEVEHWCPRLPWRSTIENITNIPNTPKAILRYTLDPLKEVILANKKFDWIMRRIEHLWPGWIRGLDKLGYSRKLNHSRKRILIYIGGLSDKAGFKLAENADHGGPLGEMVQWSDLIASLYILGHELIFSTEISQLQRYVTETKGGCPSKLGTNDYDVIFIDIVGIKHFKTATKNRMQFYKCLFRVLDTFGTEPQFNFKEWKPVTPSNKVEYGQSWGNWELNPRQFMTMYPHSPDNSFLGFVVENHLKEGEIPTKKNQGLVYGKEYYMWKGKQEYLKTIGSYLDVHATLGVVNPKEHHEMVPKFVHNHGILESTDLQNLLRETKLFIGLGFPYEGPAPLEAIANGCFYLNPRIIPPVGRENSEFFRKKPTARVLTSQNPYTEMFIGKPYVYTIDMKNRTEVAMAMQDMMSKPSPPPYIPHEFTFEGLLERVHTYVENQQFCEPHQWPPASTLITKVSKVGESCKDACYREGLVCEPELFHLLNSEEAFNKHELLCSKVEVKHSVHGPSLNIETRLCSLQKHRLLLSCVGRDNTVQRLCPCRAYEKGQVALCATCAQ